MTSKEEIKIDEGLYSRQLYVLGHEAMKKMAESNILIIGLNSLGVEVAKNVILSGVNSVTLHDIGNVEWNDLSGQFYLQESDIGKNRAQCSLHKLQELNPYVKVQCSTEKISTQFLSHFTVVTICQNIDINTLIQINNMCRDIGTKFILGQSFGLMGGIFSDFGNEFIVLDNDGERIKSSLLENLVLDKEKGELIVTCVESKPHDLQTDEHIKFIDIDELKDHFKISKIVDRYTFICKCSDEIKLTKYVSGQTCMFEQVKIPVKINFKSFEKSLAEPDFMYIDYSNFEKPRILHSCILALNKFVEKHNRFPRPYDEKDYLEFYSMVEDDDKNKKIYKQFCYTCSGNLCPMSAVIGGIIGQEVMKACSGKFMPIRQFMYFDAFECLSDNWEELVVDPLDLENRYAGQIAVFGKSFQKVLGDKNWFMVGSGAIGCELLKNFAMIGLCCDEGKLIITDMDLIEKSNLNRQFLFRDKNIGQLKSEAAAIQIKGMNPEINIVPHQNKVCPETENVYDDDFFNSLDGVANALDNVQARLYVDEKCVYYGKPLLESGTLGTKGNVQVIVPKITESYGSTRDPPEASIPVCTLKNFPNQIEHTIQYARDQFEGLFTDAPKTLKQYLENPNYLEELRKDSPQELYTVVNDLQLICKVVPKDFSDCVKWTRLFFESEFYNQISQLLHNFPLDHKTKTGALFWSGSKRCPKPIVFNELDDKHMDFIIATANLMANLFGLPNCTDKQIIKDMLSRVKVPVFKPIVGIKISENDEEEKHRMEKEQNNKQDIDINDTIKSLLKPNVLVFPLQFEKDDDTNFHMDFVTAVSNMRATNYGISIASKHKTKGIAGKIIPAIATTTSVVAGLVIFELYKLCQGHQSVESYRDTFLNLALPQIMVSEPRPCPTIKWLENKSNLWDFIEIEGDMKFENFLDMCKNKYGFDLDMLTYGNAMLYAFYQPPAKMAAKMDMTICQLIEQVTGHNVLNKKSILLYVGTHNPENEDEDMEVPPFKILLDKKPLIKLDEMSAKL